MSLTRKSGKKRVFVQALPIQYGLVLVAKRPFCEVTLPFFRMRASKAFCAQTGERFEALGPLFLPLQQKAKKLPKKIGNEQNGLFAIQGDRIWDGPPSALPGANLLKRVPNISK